MVYRTPENPDKGETQSNKGEVRNVQWWRASEIDQEPHQFLTSLLRRIIDDQAGRYNAYRQYWRDYSREYGAGGDDGDGVWNKDIIEINELGNTVDTLHSQIFKNKVVPAVCVSEASHEEYERAKGFSRWLEGAFDDADVHEEVVPPAGYDTLVAGTGPIKAYWKKTGEKKAKVCAERVDPSNLFVDKAEARHGKPRSLHQKDTYDRFVVLDEYGDTDAKRQAILEVNAVSDDDDGGTSLYTDSDQIQVWESWHLPSGPDAGDGRHTIWLMGAGSAAGATLVDEEWTEPRFPFTFMRFGARRRGFWGRSAVARLRTIQFAYDKMNRRIDECHDLMGIPRVMVRKGSGISKGHIDDVPASIIEYDGAAPPQEWNPQPITPDAYRLQDKYPDMMRGVIGVSQFDAQQSIPSNLRDVSGAFLERWSESGNARHAMLHRSYETAMVDMADLFIMVAEHAKDAGYDVITKGPGGLKSSVELLSFKALRIDRERMKLRILPMSQLPQTFAGKVEALGPLKADGTLTQKQFVRMLNIPDEEAETDLYTSDEEIIKKNLDHIAKTGEYVPPLPFDNLDLLVELGTRFINLFRIRNGVNHPSVPVLITYVMEADDLRKGQLGKSGQPADAVNDLQPQGGPIPPEMMAPPPEGMVPPGMPGPVGPPPMMDPNEMQMPPGPQGNGPVQ